MLLLILINLLCGFNNYHNESSRGGGAFECQVSWIGCLMEREGAYFIRTFCNYKISFVLNSIKLTKTLNATESFAQNVTKCYLSTKGNREI